MPKASVIRCMSSANDKMDGNLNNFLLHKYYSIGHRVGPELREPAQSQVLPQVCFLAGVTLTEEPLSGTLVCPQLGLSRHTRFAAPAQFDPKQRLRHSLASPRLLAKLSAHRPVRPSAARAGTFARQMLAFLASPDMRNIAVRADGELSPGATNYYKKPRGRQSGDGALFTPFCCNFGPFRTVSLRRCIQTGWLLCEIGPIQADCGKQPLAAPGALTGRWLIALISGLILRQNLRFGASSAKKCGAIKSVKYVSATQINHERALRSHGGAVFSVRFA